MIVRVAGWAEMPTDELSAMQLAALRAQLTIHPRKVGDHPGDPPKPIKLYQESPGVISVPRQYFETHKREHHQVIYDLSEGRKDLWPGPLKFDGELFEEQAQALKVILEQFHAGKIGGILRASPGWGKTVWSCALLASLGVPTLVVVHKEFLLKQWMERIEKFLPSAKVGLIQGDECSFKGKHVAVAMVHSLFGRTYEDALYEWPGLVITDETHRIGAATWSQVPPRFRSKWRLGISATPRRKDGADKVFYYHIGEVLFSAANRRMKPKIRRVWTEWSLVKTPGLNPSLVSKNLLLKFMTANRARNQLIGEQLVLACKAGRKIIVLSERRQHLLDLEGVLRGLWSSDDGPQPSVGYYVGGSDEDELDIASKKQVIFATKQFAEEGLDIPPLDTLFLTTPMSDVEQAAGRILRPCPGKKDPVIVDFRDERVTSCRISAEYRDKQYAKFSWI